VDPYHLFIMSLVCKIYNLPELHYNHFCFQKMATKLSIIVFSIVVLHLLLSAHMHVSVSTLYSSMFTFINFILYVPE